MTRKKVFLDIETTGLEPEKHEVWEIALAVNSDPVQSYFVPHSLQTADLGALEMNGYFSRFKTGDVARSHDLQVRSMLKGCTLICANPTFDRSFLRKRWGVEPWHYRSIDIESVAFAVLGLDDIEGMKNIADRLKQLGFDIPEPDHTAAGDVETMRACYLALKRLRNEWRGGSYVQPS